MNFTGSITRSALSLTLGMGMLGGSLLWVVPIPKEVAPKAALGAGENHLIVHRLALRQLGKRLTDEAAGRRLAPPTLVAQGR